jgi:putative flippase GtrA
MKAELVRFLVVGASNTLLGLLTIFGMKAVFLANDIVANAIGYLVGLSIGFVLNRMWTFRHHGSIAVGAVRFLAAFAIAYAINLAVVLVLIHDFAFNSFVAQTLGVPPYTLAFFFICRFYVFRPSVPASKA